MHLDEATNMFQGDNYARNWMLEHEELIRLGFLQRYHERERQDLMKKMYESSPLLAMRAVEDWDTPDMMKIARIQNMLSTISGEIWIIAGKKGSGKTACGYWLLELAAATGRKCVIAGPPQRVPKFAERVADPALAPEGSIVYVTEAGIQFNARAGMTRRSQDALSILPVIRHSKRLIIAETQSTRIIDVNFLRMMDVMILKQAPMFKEGDRHPAMNVLEILKPKDKCETLFFGGSWFTLLQHQPLPDCWSDDLSLSYAPIHKEADALDYAQELFNEGMGLTEVRRIMSARSFRRSPEWWKDMTTPYDPTQPEGEDSVPSASSPSPVEDSAPPVHSPREESQPPSSVRESPRSKGGGRRKFYADDYE